LVPPTHTELPADTVALAFAEQSSLVITPLLKVLNQAVVRFRVRAATTPTASELIAFADASGNRLAVRVASSGFSASLTSSSGAVTQAYTSM
jgi:hypothetical protein